MSEDVGLWSYVRMSRVYVRMDGIYVWIHMVYVRIFKGYIRMPALREEPSQTYVILQYKLLAAILSAVCSVIQQS